MTGRSHRFRRLAPAALAAAALLAVGACGSSSTTSSTATAKAAGHTPLSSSTPVTISFLSYNYGTPGLGGTGTQALLDAFHKAYPNITVKPRGVATADVLTRLQADTAAGSPPDVAQIGWSKMAQALTALPIVPVQQVPTAADWASATAGMSQNILKAVSVGGVVKAMPFTMSIPVLYYNADLFRKAGLDPNTPPTTIAEVKKDALAIKATGAEGAYYGIVDPGKSDYLTQSVVDSNGGSLVNGSGAVTLDSPAAVGALSAMQDLTKSGAQPAVNADVAIGAFTSGKLGMLVSSTALLVSAEKAAAGKFELRTAGFPAFAGKTARPTYSGAGLAILAKDNAHQQAAWDFVKFVTSDAGFNIITSQIGYLPLRQSVATALAGTPTVKLLQPALDQLSTVTPYTFFSGTKANQAVVTLQDEAVAPIVLLGANPGRTMTTVAGKIRKLTD